MTTNAESERQQAERALENPNAPGRPTQVAADMARADSTVYGQRSVVSDHRPAPSGPAVPSKSRS
jgi:hypothetical protein